MDPKGTRNLRSSRASGRKRSHRSDSTGDQRSQEGQEIVPQYASSQYQQAVQSEILMAPQHYGVPTTTSYWHFEPHPIAGSLQAMESALSYAPCLPTQTQGSHTSIGGYGGYAESSDPYDPNSGLTTQAPSYSYQPSPYSYQASPQTARQEVRETTGSYDTSLANTNPAQSGDYQPVPSAVGDADTDNTAESSRPSRRRKIRKYSLPEERGPETSFTKTNCSSPDCPKNREGRLPLLVLTDEQKAELSSRTKPPDAIELFRTCDNRECFESLGSNYRDYLLDNRHSHSKVPKMINDWLQNRVVYQCTTCQSPHDTWWGDEHLDSRGASPDPRSNRYTPTNVCAKGITDKVNLALQALAPMIESNPSFRQKQYRNIEEGKTDHNIRSVCGQTRKLRNDRRKILASQQEEVAGPSKQYQEEEEPADED